MGDSETLAQTSVAPEYSSLDDTVIDMSVHVPSADGGSVQAAQYTNGTNSVADGSGLDSGSISTTAVIPMQQEAPSFMVHETNEEVTNVADASSGLVQVAGYDSSLNSNGIDDAGNLTSAGGAENGVISDGVAALHQPVDGPGLSAEEERLWSILTTNSLDFNAWTMLIEETERTSVGNVLKIRKVYDMFLAEFPLCYGYWKKYADHEARLSSVNKVAEVYERAIQGVTYSVDMWLHYCVFAISTYGDPETIRGLFERAIAYVGTDYLCFPLWDKYIEYEMSQLDWPRVATIFTRVLEIPNQQLDRYFEGFKELVASRPLSELRTAEETPGAVVGQENEGEVPPGAADQSMESSTTSLKDAEDLEEYIAIREDIYNKAKEFDSKINGFEIAIRRPYFHVRPLNAAELENWHNYLDFIEAGNDFNKVVKLFERCLVACANYSEYWIRYILCMEASGSMELADNALARATQVFVKRQPEIHLFAAGLKEQHGDIPGARASYRHIHDGLSPGLLEAIIKHANMEHRLGNLEDAFSLYEQAIAIEKGKEHSQTLPLLFAQYSRFVFLVSGKADKVREILDQAVESSQLSKPFLEAMIHFESIQTLPKRVEYLDTLVDKFIVADPSNPSVASAAEKEELSSIFLEFLDLFGDLESKKKAAYRHYKLFLRHNSTTESRKRNADDYLVSDKMKLAKSHISPSATSAASAYPGTQNQWPVSYSAQPQAWPQAQGQQWNPAYAQQAAYGAYPSYGTSYAQPQAQVPTSAPQAVQYGTYPQTYPAQAYPQQQEYAQPAAATALTSALQPVSSATYYANYYQ